MDVFDKLTQWKKDAEALATRHEQAMTNILLGVAAVLILVALFGKPHHKAMATIYIVL